MPAALAAVAAALDVAAAGMLELGGTCHCSHLKLPSGQPARVVTTTGSPEEYHEGGYPGGSAVPAILIVLNCALICRDSGASKPSSVTVMKARRSSPNELLYT